MRPSRLLDAEDRARIEAAVREAEGGTSGEIVVAVVRACDEYAAAGWRCGVLLAALALLAAAVADVDWPLSALLVAQAASVAAGHALARVDAVRRFFISEDRLRTCAERRAWATFSERGLHLTAGRTGILIFVGLLEHRVVVLADEAVNRALDPDESWDEVVELVLNGVRERALADGLIAATRRCGEILSHPLPSPEEPHDEIHTALVLED